MVGPVVQSREAVKRSHDATLSLFRIPPGSYHRSCTLSVMPQRGLCGGNLLKEQLRRRKSDRPSSKGVKQIGAKEDHLYPETGVKRRFSGRKISPSNSRGEGSGRLAARFEIGYEKLWPIIKSLSVTASERSRPSPKKEMGGSFRDC